MQFLFVYKFPVFVGIRFRQPKMSVIDLLEFARFCRTPTTTGKREMMLYVVVCAICSLL